MSIAQQVFVVFYAIFWGAVFNVQGRWRMFQPLPRYPHVKHRLLLSWGLLNIVPILFFGWSFFRLRGAAATSPETWGLVETLLQVSAGVLPAFAIFGFYRLWMGIIEMAPAYYYERGSTQSSELRNIDPTIETLHLQHPFPRPNFIAAALYFVIALVGPYLV